MLLCGVVLLSLGTVLIIGRKRLPCSIRKMGLILIAAALAGLSVGIDAIKNPVLFDGNRIRRNENGDGTYQAEVELQAEGLTEGSPYLLEIPEQKLTMEEEQFYLNEAEKEIDSGFLGENESLRCIRDMVMIRDTYQNGRVKAEWSFDNYKVMDPEGNVIPDELPEEGELVEAQAELSCGDSMRKYCFYFQVFPHRFDKREEFFAELEKYFEKEAQKPGESYFALPEEILRYPVTWREKKEHKPEKILLLGMSAAALIPLAERSRRQKEEKERWRKLCMEYPDLVSKLALLLGSGMTLSGAWKKITAAYAKKQKESGTEPLPVYEEMAVTWREIESGVGEERAYERFGARCGQPQYRRLGTLLVRNLKKGSRNMTVLLEAEAENAFEERKSAAKKYGEEAGTKLLFPMMIMLGIIMAVLVVPAVLTFSL